MRRGWVAVAATGALTASLFASLLPPFPAHSSGALASGPWWGSVTQVGQGPGNIDISGGVVATPDDTVVLTGYFDGTVSFPRRDGSLITLTARGTQDIFVAAISGDDTAFSWVAQAGGTSQDFPWASTVLRDGSVVIAGQFKGTATFPTGNPAPDDSITLVAAGQEDVFIAALKPGLPSFAWARRIGSTTQDTARNLNVTRDDTLLVTGYVAGTGYFPTGRPAPDDSITVSGAPANYVAEIDPRTGYTSWVRPWALTDWGDVPDVAEKADGTLIVTSAFVNTVTLPTASGSTSLTATGSTNSFVAALDPASKFFVWARGISGPGTVRVNDVKVTADDTVVVGGSQFADASFPTSSGSITLPSPWDNRGFVAAMGPGSTYFDWARQIRGGQWDSAYVQGLALTADDTILAAGRGANLQFLLSADDSITLITPPGNNNDLYVAALNPKTTYFTWAQEAGGSSNEGYQGLARLSTGTPVLAGASTSTASLPTSPSTSLTVTGRWVGMLGPWPVRVPPGAPRTPTASAGIAAASVSWLAPTSYGSHPITSYEVVSSPAGGSCTIAAPALTCNVLGLANGTAYTFTVRAISGAGQGPWSAPTSAVTPTSPPPPPPAMPPGPPYLTGAKPSNQAVTLTWRRPDYEGTSPVTEYRVYAAPGGQVCTVPARTSATYSCTASGLTNGRSYEFWVTAVNAIGESLPSVRLTATPRPDKPERPIFTSLVGGNESAVATWDPPVSDGGAPITAYYVYSSTGGGVCKVPASAGPPYSCKITGLKNWVSYQMWVTAVNEAGESPQSLRRTVLPFPTVPGPPLDLAGTAGNKRIHFAWKPPADEGSFPIQVYEVQLSPGGATCAVNAPETSCTVTGLTPGTNYIARVRAFSKAGSGAYSNWTARINVPAPPPPGISVEVRRRAADPDQVVVSGSTTDIKSGTALWVWIHRENEYGYIDSFQGTGRPVVAADGTFTWERTAPVGRIWEVIWCTGPNVTGICSRWTLLVDPTT